MTQKKKEGVFLRGLVILLAIVTVGIAIIYSSPTEQRFLPFLLTLILGLLASGLYAIPRVSRNYEDLLWGYSGITMLIVLFGGTFSTRYLMDLGVISQSWALQLMLAYIPISTSCCFIAYEAIDHAKKDEKHSAHLRRLGGRVVLMAVFVVPFLALSAALSTLFPASQPTTPALVISSLLTVTALLLLRRKMNIKELFQKLEKGEW